MAQAQTSKSKARFARWAVEDAVGLVRDAASPRGLGFAAGAVTVLAPLSRWDERISGEMELPEGRPLHGFLAVANEAGSWKMIYPAAGLFAATLVTDDTRLQDAAFTSVQSMFVAAKVTEALKHAVGRYRPASREGAHQFDPFSGHNAFPSGHTTSAFAMVTPWVLYYPHPVTFGLFILSTGTAVARVAGHAHWPTDVAAGAAVGFATAWYLTKRHGGLKDDFLLVPTAAPGHLGLTMQARF